jgi:hypothetical protein
MIGSDTDAWRQISVHLLVGEKLLWAGRPAQGLRLRRSDLYLIPFGLGWCVFGVLFLWGAFKVGSAQALWFGLPFGLCSVVIGLFIVIGRHFFDAWVRARTIYGLTDRRLVIVSNNPSPTLDLPYLRDITDVCLRKGRGGDGTIHLGTDTIVCSGDSDYKLTYSLDLIPDAAQVYRLIEDAKARSQRTGNQSAIC